MQPAIPKAKIFAKGYPAELNELGRDIAFVEPDLVFGLYALLRAAGMTLSYSEAEVLSGQATQFVYRIDQPECQQISFLPPVDTLYKGLGVTWKEVTPSDTETAFGILHEWVGAGSLALARLKEPVLVFGFAASGLEQHLIGARIWSRLQEIVLSPGECEKDFWRYPIDEGNVLLRIEHAPRDIPQSTDMVRAVARRAVHSWHDTPLAECAAGDQAYRDLARDLRDDQIDYAHPHRASWMGRGLWKQWTARLHVERFLDRTAPRFGGKERTAVTHAAFCYGQCVDAWKKWASYLGPTWNAAATGFLPPFPAPFIAHWRDMQRRESAAQWIEQARDWEEKAVGELVKIL